MSNLSNKKTQRMSNEWLSGELHYLGWVFGRDVKVRLIVISSYRYNVGIGKSFEYYAKSKNPVHVQGIRRKREKGLGYLDGM